MSHKVDDIHKPVGAQGIEISQLFPTISSAPEPKDIQIELVEEPLIPKAGPATTTSSTGLLFATGWRLWEADAFGLHAA